ncbi:sulfite exporter TauE/SafE family protein [Metabacillus halosaccharovorans]|uniref:sulfite exporter TauE/SafE family protein n=1 Tax=Metabacillus halosaccharovorans TaxID=930124 RepID=UPI000994935C|nr:sulfite exporter TauE/SafE family protein [Metabacillus halosaccharovorans]
MLLVLLFFIGLAGGMLGSLVGLGGGIIIVPALLFIGNYTSLLPSITPQLAVGTSMIILIVTGLSSTLSYMKQKTVYFKAGMIFFIGSGPGAFVGALINKTIDLHLFYIFFGTFVIFISLLLSVQKYLKPNTNPVGITHTFRDKQGEEHILQFQPVLAVLIAFIVGVLSGLFGIGGGSLMVPTMLLLFRFPASIVVATSMFMVFLSSIVGSIAHIQLGNIEWLWILVLAPGAWIGAKAGAFINRRLKDGTVIVILRLVLVVVGVRLIFQGL